MCEQTHGLYWTETKSGHGTITRDKPLHPLSQAESAKKPKGVILPPQNHPTPSELCLRDLVHIKPENSSQQIPPPCDKHIDTHPAHRWEISGICG